MFNLFHIGTWAAAGRPFDLVHIGTWAAARKRCFGRSGVLLGGGLLRSLHGFRIIGSRLPLYKRDGVHGTGRQTVPQTIAVIIPQQFCLSIHHADGTLMTGGSTGAAAVTFLFINLNNSSYHFVTSCYCKSEKIIRA